jgi:hypothetical protein
MPGCYYPPVAQYFYLIWIAFLVPCVFEFQLAEILIHKSLFESLLRCKVYMGTEQATAFLVLLVFKCAFYSLISIPFYIVSLTACIHLGNLTL